MTLPQEYLYTKDHEWIRTESDGSATVGITDFAQSELGDLVFVDLPKVGSSISAGKAFCVVESTKAASDVYAPLDATVVAVNETLAAQPELVNQSPYEKGWLCRLTLQDKNILSTLLTPKQYEEFLAGK